MFHHHNKKPSVSPIASPRVRTVRLLKDPEELHAAVERAQAFERSRVDEYQRRVGAYDRFLTAPSGSSAVVMPIDSSINLP